MTPHTITPSPAAPPVPELVGVGLFTSRPARLRLLPTHAGGLVLHRADQQDAPECPARIEHLSPTPIPAFARLPARHTCLGHPQTPHATVATVEHLLSALAGLNLWHARGEIDGPEVPIFDGSALPFAHALAHATPTSIPAPIVVREPIRVGDDRAWITAEPLAPNEPATLAYILDYGPTSPIPAQRATWTVGDRDDYLARIAPARTFCLADEARAMHAAGLFRGLSPRDLLVIGPDGPIDNAYRGDDEPARHKLLDLIGDLALVGAPVAARITACRAGHALNHATALALRRLASPD